MLSVYTMGFYSVITSFAVGKKTQLGIILLNKKPRCRQILHAFSHVQSQIEKKVEGGLCEKKKGTGGGGGGVRENVIKVCYIHV